MSRYLIVAHQTATSDELIAKLRELAAEDQSAHFTLLVPATPVNHLLTWTEGEATARARAVAAEARACFEREGLHVEDARPADESPLLAISDGLSDSYYDAVVISTLPPGISRWLKLDVHERARQRFDLPVISVVASKPRAAVG